MLRDIRQFFADLAVMEVTTPTLGASGVSDLYLTNLTVDLPGGPGYMQTSPEYAMKRLVAGGSGAIYQICPAFRGGESGSRHSMEFTILEWYRPGFSLAELIGEVQLLLRRVGGALGPFEQVEYKVLFKEFIGVNPHVATIEALRRAARERHVDDTHIDRLDDEGCLCDYLDLMFSALVEPQLERAVVVDFPSCQAALATRGRNSAGELVARRFELFCKGMELANGYDELTDSAELKRRFDANNQLRARRGIPQIPDDGKLLAALPQLPGCAGVAVGLDRLLMCIGNLKDLNEAISFSQDLA